MVVLWGLCQWNNFPPSNYRTCLPLRGSQQQIILHLQITEAQLTASLQVVHNSTSGKNAIVWPQLSPYCVVASHGGQRWTREAEERTTCPRRGVLVRAGCTTQKQSSSTLWAPQLEKTGRTCRAFSTVTSYRTSSLHFRADAALLGKHTPCMELTV